jgi:hypothetical protein
MYVKNQPSIEESLMLLAAGYFDESTDGEFEERVFTVGGYVTSGYPAIHLDLKWRDLLTKYEIEYFKASELEAGIGQFAKFRDKPKNASKDRFTEREREFFRCIKTEFVDLLSQQEGMIGISATVHMRQFKAFALDHPDLFRKLPTVYGLCAQLVMVDAGYLMNETQASNPPHLHGLLRPIFDSHKDYERLTVDTFDRFCKANPEASRLLLPPIFEDDKKYLCLQSADLFVYEVRRTISNYFFEPKRELRIAMKKLFPQAAHSYVLDYEALKLIAEWQGFEQRIPVQTLEETAE